MDLIDQKFFNLKLSVRLHSVETLGTREVFSSQEDNHVQEKQPNVHCYAPLPTIFVIVCFQLDPRICFVFYGPSLLSKMSGRKHLRCSLGLFAPVGSNHLAKRPEQRNNPQIGPFLGQICLFVFI